MVVSFHYPNSLFSDKNKFFILSAQTTQALLFFVWCLNVKEIRDPLRYSNYSLNTKNTQQLSSTEGWGLSLT